LLALIILLVCPSGSQAEFTGSLSVTSNYFWRGYTKSSDNPAIQGFLEYQHDSGLYTGGWLSEVDFSDDLSSNPASLEFSPYVGWSLPITDDWRADAELVHYFYNGDIFDSSANYNELYLRAHYRDLLSAQFAYADDAYDRGNSTFDAFLNGRYALTDTLQTSAGLGFSWARDVLEYNYLYWDAGLTWFLPRGGIDLRFVGVRETTIEAETDWAYDPDLVHDKFILTFTVGF